MKNKKLASLFLAIAMVFSMAVPAFASGETPATGDSSTTTPAATNPNERTTDFEGKTELYTIDITVSTPTNLIVNPYKIPVTVTGFEDTVSDQVITAATFITNKTNVNLKASAKITVTPTADVKLISDVTKVNVATEEYQLGKFTPATSESADDAKWEPTAESSTLKPGKYVPKGVFLAFEMMNVTDNESQPTSWKAPNAIPANTADGATASKGSTIILADGDNTLNECLTLDAVGADDDPNYAAFHFTGLANIYPKKPNKANPTTVSNTTAITGAANHPENYATDFVDDNWTENDKIAAKVVLTFTPDLDATPPTAANASSGTTTNP